MKNLTKIKIFLFFNFLILIYEKNRKKYKKVGIIGLRHEANVGNNLIKYAISIKLKELDFIPYIIGTHLQNYNITFLKENTNCIIIKENFTEIKRNDYDILMVNSDQTWRRFDDHFYDYGFLKFAENWNITKFVYAASIGYDYWQLTQKDENVVKLLLKNFTGISIRGKGSIGLIEKHLGIKPLLVLDPTLLIDKKYYLKLIKNYKPNINIKENYIFTYLLEIEKNTINFIQKSFENLKFKNYQIEMNETNSIEKFIYGISHSKAVITNSYHGTVFSIIFNKPFISFIFKNSPKERLYTLKQIFNLENRIIEYYEQPDVNLLNTPLNFNETLMELMKVESINYLKKNLGIINNDMI
jgi:hypothetical protein